ncbi:GNAT family N-acetyltransferase [Novosphingobium sp. G106]|uniref:GNAT family N-acetyltransferase n=1 Tax=Novosphingobium sp. G106 TaxID=2849500 RepID=UPI001C2D8F5D|nr:GNAT family N-acetyltransferase [Novosphingobium sp. G106]MBV1690818.1 GNAT family N-acetyltransferase [Novosphingobium sp. G106]
MSDEPRIEPATGAEAAEIAEIYAHHVIHGTATFEIEPPDAAEIAARMERLHAAGMPWLVARDAAGVLLGYAYAGRYHTRAAYRDTVENSVYIRHDKLGQGLGTRLLGALLEECEARGVRQVIAGIAATEPSSVALHAKAGFVEVGRLRSVGRKHGKWIDVLYMQRALGDGDTSPPAEEPG